MDDIRGPQSDNRTVILGSTGSGKTFFAVALLSSRPWHIYPAIIFDFKGDELLQSLGATEISIQDNPPIEPGLYIVRPMPGDDEFVSQFFMKCWSQGHIILYIDEGYMVPLRDKWFRACLTQGRSKKIEMIILSQRPKWMDTFSFTEASFIALFNINFEDDRKHVKAYLGGTKPGLLPKYHCLWYDVERQNGAIVEPVPERNVLISRFHKRIENMLKEKFVEERTIKL